MRKLVIFSILVLAPAGGLFAQVPAAERAALIAIYDSTDGVNWYGQLHWNDPPGNECNWYRVTCTGGNVTKLELNDNNLNGTIPGQLEDLTMLENLTLKGNPLLTGTIPPELGNLLNLEWLYLFNSDLVGTIPPELGDLPALTRLLLHENRLSGEIPPDLGDLTNLEWLELAKNQLTGSIPTELGDLLNLEYLFLHDNQLSGAIPIELGNLADLQKLYLNRNQLSGGIPVEFSNLSSIREMSLFSNMLTGDIPPELWMCSTMRQIDFGDNLLTGTIPPEFGLLTVLRMLFLDDNDLDGIIPPELGDLFFLRQLSLANNQLHGEIPSEFGDLANVERLYLQGNKLTGQVPGEIDDTALAKHDGMDLRWNALYNADPNLDVFLDLRQIGVVWKPTETLAPTDLRVGTVTDHTVQVTWDPVSTVLDGGFETFYRLSGGGAWTSAGRTSDKTVLGMPVTGLSPGTTYDLTVATYSSPHANNTNTVLSELGPIETATTSNIGCTAPVITHTWGGRGATLALTQAYDTYDWNTGEITASVVVTPSQPEHFWVTVTWPGSCQDSAIILVDPSLFADGFTSGDTSAWTTVSP